MARNVILQDGQKLITVVTACRTDPRVSQRTTFAIGPGVTLRDIKLIAGVPLHDQLALDGRADYLAENEDVYRAIPAGAILRSVRAGASASHPCREEGREL